MARKCVKPSFHGRLRNLFLIAEKHDDFYCFKKKKNEMATIGNLHCICA